ncbi:hypothetical protein SKAU_G00374710 [Synaphobranchus kaupii]|uniref:Uncharacterized protein n=1 Tax=Synaphobranchus kaupii TaxID=118154 RepID=A0A9Q1IFC7_SYNKA|nr:hypothetical protein SKAU_G00374710 [Synaphobranchus kaupii]
MSVGLTYVFFNNTLHSSMSSVYILDYLPISELTCNAVGKVLDKSGPRTVWNRKNITPLNHTSVPGIRSSVMGHIVPHSYLYPLWFTMLCLSVLSRSVRQI